VRRSSAIGSYARILPERRAVRIILGFESVHAGNSIERERVRPLGEAEGSAPESALTLVEKGQKPGQEDLFRALLAPPVPPPWSHAS
jgi:hypothetical protein